MSLTVAYAALATGIVVWLLLVRKLSARSWENPPVAEGAAHGGDAGGDAGTGVVAGPPARVGLWVLLAVVTSLFGLFISAYYMRMGGHGHGTGVGHDWMRLPEPAILWLNTAVLVLASVAMQWARSSVHSSTLASTLGGQAQRTWSGLLLGGLLTLLFLAGQFYAWAEVRASDAFTPRNPAIAFFYLLTAVHGLHLLGGLFVWGRTLARMRRRDVELIDVSLSVQLCTVYWHYLLLVWVGLFALLLST